MMTDFPTAHGTVVVERMLDVPVSRVYAAIANAEERARWSAPSDTAVFVYDETNFSIGGRDLARCGAKEDPRYRVEARYVDIVRAAHAADWHPVSLHPRLRIDDVLAQARLVPGQVRPPHGVGIAIVLERRRLAAEHALEARPDRVGLLGVARDAGWVERLAV